MASITAAQRRVKDHVNAWISEAMVRVIGGARDLNLFFAEDDCESAC